MKSNCFMIKTLVVAGLTIAGCEQENPRPRISGGNPGGNADSNHWLIPVEMVFDGGPGKDGIPALLNPQKVDPDQTGNNYLNDDDLVLGVKYRSEILAYPHAILDWHEIINDAVNGKPIAITYCPLTGTGIGWSREIHDLRATTFGVSGLLYNSNLILYDRLTESNWSQIGGQCINGELVGSTPELVPLIEMPWGKWKELFPGSKVVTRFTGYSKRFGIYPYGDYKTSSLLLFPSLPHDGRLPRKERVLGIIKHGKAKVYRFSSFGSTLSVIHDEIQGEKLIIAGIYDSFMVGYGSQMSDGTILMFSPAEEEGFLRDQEGNKWSLFGEAVSGPREGQQLPDLNSFMGYWFSIAAFYPDPVIYQ
jgi:hypothetical protein